LPSSSAIARYLPPLGEYAMALGEDPMDVAVPELGNSTNPPGTSGVWDVAPSGVGVEFAGVGVGDGDADADGDAVGDPGTTPTVLRSVEPSGA
jgi:hypothetical protein